MNDNFKIINGNSLEVLDTLEENSVGSIITDPPYELGFMGKGWDKSGVAYNVELWKKALRVLKPGGYLLAFGGTRTFHRIACAIEDAGFEIRDTIMWLYGSGFPKSMNIGLAIDKKNGVESQVVGTGKSGAKETHTNSLNLVNNPFGGEYEIKKANNEWNGWGTALKPAYEPIIVAKKPVKDTIVDNVLEYGVGGINIDECRVGNETISTHNAPKGTFAGGEWGRGSDTNSYTDHTGRFPANVILTYDDTDYEEVCGGMPDSKGGQGKGFKAEDYEEKKTATTFTRGDFVPYNDDGSASRYFYCAKASSKDRDEGLDMFEAKQMYSEESGNQFGYGNANGDTFGDRIASVMRKNIHPTVKPVDLMQYLVRLVTPKGETVLDIFNGSGSTGKAVAFENREREADYKYIGIELDPEYCKISEARIDYALNKYEYDMIQDIKKEERETGQMSLFDFGEDYDL